MSADQETRLWLTMLRDYIESRIKAALPFVRDGKLDLSSKNIVGTVPVEHGGSGTNTGVTIRGASDYDDSSAPVVGQVITWNGAKFHAADASGGLTNPMTTPDDLIIGDTGGTPKRLAKGGANTVLGIDATGTLGYTADPISPPRTSLDPTTAAGDLLYRSATSTVTTLAIGFIGDSITIDVPSGGSAPPSLVATDLAVHGLTVTAVNQGVSSTQTNDWLPASTNLTTAKAAFAAAGVRLVHIMLGTNDAYTGFTTNTAAQFRANMQAIIGDLVGSGYLVVLAQPPYSSLSRDLTLLVAYQDELRALSNGVTTFLGDTSAYAYFAAHTSELADGVHPTATGSQSLATMWEAALAPLVRSLAYVQALARLPIGTTGQLLTVVSGLPAWADAPTVARETYGVVFTGAGDVALRGDGAIVTKRN